MSIDYCRTKTPDLYWVGRWGILNQRNCFCSFCSRGLLWGTACLVSLDDSKDRLIKEFLGHHMRHRVLLFYNANLQISGCVPKFLRLLFFRFIIHVAKIAVRYPRTWDRRLFFF